MKAFFEKFEDGFDFVFDGRVLLKHRSARPAVRCARGNSAIKMYRGNYDISDRPSPISELCFANVDSDKVELRSSEAGSAEVILKLVTALDCLSLQIKALDETCDRLILNLHAEANEYVWGGGEQMSYLDLRGLSFPMWTSEPGVGRDKASALTRIMDEEGMAGGDYWTTNYPQPTFLSSRLYSCHLNSSAYSEMDFSHSDTHQITVWEGAARFEFRAAESYPELVSQLASRFGKQPPLPDWAIEGAIMGLKDGARSFERLDTIIAAGTKVTGLWCEDWVGIRQTSFGRRLFWNWDWNSDRHPGLPEKIAALGEQGIRFLGYVNPYLAIDGTQYEEARAAGYLALHLDNSDPYIVDFGEFDCGIVDFTNPAACDWFAERIIGKEMLDFGLSGWMADFGEYLPTDLRLHDGRDPMLAHNQWPVLWAKVNADAVKSRGKTGDAVFFMRAGFSGVQEHCPLLWAGDQCVDFSRHDGIGTVITAALSVGLLGNAYSHSDVGGYTSLHGLVRTEELFMRWAEMAAFTPVMRTHEGNRPDDNLQVDSNAELLAHFAAMSRIHSALAPYVRSICDEAATAGLPAQRPLFLHYSGDDAYLTCQDQYLYGRDLLVAPIITEGASEREVLIPGDEEWIHIWSGQTYTGGRHMVSAPFGSPPVFARADSPFTALFVTLKEVRGAISP